MGIVKEFLNDVIKPSFEELRDIFKESVEDFKELKEEYNQLTDEEKKEVKLKAKDELKDVFQLIRDDSKELKKDFNHMIKEVKDSLEDNDEISKQEKKAILEIIKLINPEPITNKILFYEENPIKAIED